MRSLPTSAILTGAAVAVATLGFCATISAAHAYNNSANTTCRWPFTPGYLLSVTYRPASGSEAPSGIYTTAYDNAKADWYATASPANFTLNSGQSSHRWRIAYQGLTGQLGNRTYTCGSNGKFSTTLVTLNRSELEGPWPDAWYKQWIASHELGHQIALGHTDGQGPWYYVGGTMTASPDQGPPYGANGARPDDVCAVNQIYPSQAWPATTPCGY